jgi:hypothetical protein
MHEEKQLTRQIKRKELQQTIELLKKDMFQKDKKQSTSSKDQVMENNTDEELNRETERILKKNREKNECLTGNVITKTEAETDGTSQPIEHADKGKTSANNSWKSPELPGNI